MTEPRLASTRQAEYVTAQRIAEIIPYTERQIINLARNGDIPSAKKSKTKWLFDELRFRKWLKYRESICQHSNVSEAENYNYQGWTKLRYRALKESNGLCQLCGRGAAHGVALHADHIKPRSKYPELALDINNIQVLCEDCNHGKGNWDESDWRKS